MRLWILSALFCALTSTSDSARAQEASREEKGTDAVRVMSYNVNDGTPGNASTLTAIADQDADILLLQETTPEWRRALLRRLDRRYPHVQFYHHRRARGLAILSKYPFITELVKSPLERLPAWRALVDTPIGQLQIINLQLPSAPERGDLMQGYFATQNLRRQEPHAYVEYLSEDLPTIIAGNVHEAITEKSKPAGLDRGLRSVLGNEHVPTRRWTLLNREMTWQVDHMLVNDRVMIEAASVIQGGGSDHLPVVATLRIRPAAD